MEAAAGMTEFVQAFPQAGAVMGDLIAESQDWPNSMEISKRLKKIIPAGILDPEDDDAPEQQQDPQASPEQQIIRIATFNNPPYYAENLPEFGFLAQITTEVLKP